MIRDSSCRRLGPWMKLSPRGPCHSTAALWVTGKHKDDACVTAALGRGGNMRVRSKREERYSFSKTPPLCIFLRVRLDNWALTQSGIHLKVPWRFVAVAAERNKTFMRSWKSRDGREEITKKSGRVEGVKTAVLSCFLLTRRAECWWWLTRWRSKVTVSDSSGRPCGQLPGLTAVTDGGDEEMTETERCCSAAAPARRSSPRGRLLLSLITFNYSSKRWIQIEQNMKGRRIKYSGNHLNSETSAVLVVWDLEVPPDTSLPPYFVL